MDLAAQVLLLHCLLKLVTVVQCATQALSESVANGLNYYGWSGTKETEKFIRVFDKFFDCV